MEISHKNLHMDLHGDLLFCYLNQFAIIILIHVTNIYGSYGYSIICLIYALPLQVSRHRTPTGSSGTLRNDIVSSLSN